MEVIETDHQKDRKMVMVRVGYCKLKFYKWNGSGHSKVHSVNEVEIGAEVV